jgi:SIR2-like domain
MQLLTSDASEWIEIAQDGEDEARQRLDARLRQLLEAERLIVVAGLGTSLCVQENDEYVAPSMADLWKAAKQKAGDAAWEAALLAAAWRNEAEEDIELLLSRCQMALELSGDEALGDFIKTCEKEIVDTCRFVNAETPLPVHEIFLRRIARRPTRLPRTQLFTTNYDLAFETAASRTGFAVLDGFSHVAPQRFDSSYFDVDLAVRDRERAAAAVEWMPNVFQLLKLHGSVDWKASSSGTERKAQPDQPLIVYPRSSKFEVSYQQPFLDLMARFQMSLRRPDTAVLVVGSGLRDQHIAEPLMAAVQTNVRMSLVFVSPNADSTTTPSVAKLTDLARRGDRRLGLLAATFEDLVGCLPDLVAPTETELHRERTGL